MGMGPAHLINHATGLLGQAAVSQIEVEELPFEVGTTFRVLRSLSEKVQTAAQSNCFPLVLAGGCISCVGTLAGVGARPVGVVWMDAHGDFNTPETTLSGFLDGMALAAATGRCWQNLTLSVPGFRPVSEKNVVLIGARDLDPEERRLLERSAVSWIQTDTMRERGTEAALGQALEGLEADQVYLHIDLDVLDRSEANVNQFSSAGGLTLAELQQIVRLVAAARSVVAAAITAYDPSYDKDGRALRAGMQLIKELRRIGQPI
jgi:arginase